jgi:hypothetical protein
MNWLGYLALLFSVACLVLHGRWSVGAAIAAALCGLLSALIRHWDLVKSSLDSFAAKVAVAIVAAAALFFSPWIANQVLSEVTLLRPSAFPAAYSAFQYIATLVLWGMLAYLALIAVAIFNVQQIFSGAASKIKREWYVRTEILASLGRLAGLAVLLLYLAPLFLRAANYDSGGVLSRFVIATSFVENGGQSVWISSAGPNFPADCQRLAKEKNLDLTKPYTCSARPIRCSNIDPDAKIAFLDDKGAIVIAKDVASSDVLRELVPMRFDLAECSPLGQGLLTATGARRGLLQRDGITTANLATLQHRSIHANISVVVLGCRTQDPRIFGEIALRERRHHAPGARTSDAQANSISNRDDLPDPSILRELLLAIRSLYHNVRTKPSDFEASLRI